MTYNQKKFIAAGVDVSSEKLDLFIMDKEEQGKHKIFSNTKHGIEKMIEWLEINNFEGKVVMESTGSYHELLAVTLFIAEFNVFVINPIQAKKYTISQIRKIKTDKNDAKILAEMALKEKKMPVFNFTSKELEIKKRFSLIRSLEKQLQSLTATVKNYEQAQNKLNNNLIKVEEEIVEIVNSLSKKIKKLEQEVTKLVFPKNDKQSQKDKEILTSIVGVSEYYAALVYFYYSRVKGEKMSSWIAYTGLEVSIVESGKWRGTGKLVKRGNKYLRKRNFGAGWGATMHDEHFREYYDLLKKNGRKHKESLVIIGRKILRIAYSCLKKQEKFNPKELEKILKKLKEENEIKK